MLFVVSATLVAGYIFLFQPHVSFEEVRISNQLKEVNAVFVNVTGDPLCAKLYKLDRMDNNKPVASDTPFFITLPDGAPSPIGGNLGYADNIYVLRGYAYQYEEKNLLTGASNTMPSYRFDVIAWEIKTPYKKWKEPAPNEVGSIESKISTDPVSFQFTDTDHNPSQFIDNNYIDCFR